MRLLCGLVVAAVVINGAYFWSIFACDPYGPKSPPSSDAVPHIDSADEESPMIVDRAVSRHDKGDTVEPVALPSEMTEEDMVDLVQAYTAIGMWETLSIVGLVLLGGFFYAAWGR